MQFPAYGQLNTFQEGDVLSADKMNENFQHLEQQFRGARSIKVDCAAGEKINDAIENGFSDINVSGTCTENLLYEVWPLIVNDGDPNFRDNTKLAPRYLKITGADSTAKIQDATSQAESTIYMNSGTTLLLDNITISGGLYGISVTRNSNLLMSGVTIENFNEMGVRLSDNAWLGVDDGGIIINGDGSRSGIVLGSGPTAWIHRFSISGVQIGLEAGAGSTVLTGGYTISASDVGLRIIDSQFLQYGGSGRDGKITGTSGAAVWVFQGIFNVWDPGALELHDLIGGRGIDLWESKASINNLKLLAFDNTGSGWNPALQLSGGSSAYINGAVISGSTDGALVSISDGSITKIENSTLTVGSASNAIDAYGSTRIVLRNSNISGSVTDNLVNIDQGSTAQIKNSSSISGSVGGALVSTSHGSSSDIRDSTFTLNSGNRALAVQQSSNLEMWNSTLSGTATEELVDVRRLSNAIIRNESKLSQSGSDTPDVRVSNLSFLSVWSDSSINSVDCHMKGTVSADEGTVTTLSSSCTE